MSQVPVYSIFKVHEAAPDCGWERTPSLTLNKEAIFEGVFQKKLKKFFVPLGKQKSRPSENGKAALRLNDLLVHIYIVYCGQAYGRRAILKRLKGKKRLIVGNHDGSWMTKFDYARYFFSVDKFLETSDGKRSLTLCHYPMLSWKHAKRSYMIHGHIHNDTRADFWPLIAARENVLNAGVDINSFMPVTFDELLENNRHFKENSLAESYT